MKYVFLAAIFILISVLSACSTAINNYGNDRREIFIPMFL